MKKILLTTVLALLGTAGTQAAFIAQWTFETSIPTTAGPLAPEVGAGTANGSTGGVWSNPAGFGSNESWSSNTWDVNDYFQFQVSTVGYTGISLDWQQTGSSTGPGSFTLAYSLDGSSFTNFGTYSVTVDSWNGTITPAASQKAFDLSAVTTLDNQPTVYFRLVDNSTTSIGLGIVAAGGTGRVDNFSVIATPVPEPSTYALIGLGLAGIVVLRRMRPLAKA